MRVISEVMLLARFTGLAVAEAVTMSMPISDENSRIRNVPVPGPKKPSYRPISAPLSRHSISRLRVTGLGWVCTSFFRATSTATTGMATIMKMCMNSLPRRLDSQVPNQAQGSVPAMAKAAGSHRIFLLLKKRNVAAMEAKHAENLLQPEARP